MTDWRDLEAEAERRQQIGPAMPVAGWPGARFVHELSRTSAENNETPLGGAS
jgi:hypothetical protein